MDRIQAESTTVATPADRAIVIQGIANEHPAASQMMASNPALIEDGPGVGSVAVVHFVFATVVSSDPGEPQTFDEAWNGPEKHHW